MKWTAVLSARAPGSAIQGRLRTREAREERRGGETLRISFHLRADTMSDTIHYFPGRSFYGRSCPTYSTRRISQLPPLFGPVICPTLRRWTYMEARRNYPIMLRGEMGPLGTHSMIIRHADFDDYYSLAFFPILYCERQNEDKLNWCSFIFSQ